MAQFSQDNGGQVTDDRTSSTSRRKLTLKQTKFAAAYVDPDAANGNGTLAAKIAGYKGGSDQLAVQGSVNLRNENIQQVISATLDAMIEHALDRLGDALDATTSRPFLDKAGTIVYAEPVPDYRIRLQAIQFLFHLHGKCTADPEPAHELDTGAAHDHLGQIQPADRVLFQQAAEIEAQLHELDDNPDTGGGDHDSRE
jgi:Terminase small subunit